MKHNQDVGDLPISSTLLVSDTNQRLAHLGNDNQRDDTKSIFSQRREPDKILNYKAGQSSEPSLTWVHITPILSPRKSCFSHTDTATASSNGRILTSKISSPAMQDSFISSTTPSNHTNNQKKPVLCQSQSVADKHSDGETTHSQQGQSQSPIVTLKSLPEVCPAILETWCVDHKKSQQPTFFYTKLKVAVTGRKKETSWWSVVFTYAFLVEKRKELLFIYIMDPTSSMPHVKLLFQAGHTCVKPSKIHKNV